MPETPYLSQYELTSSCDGLSRIVIAGNREGDPHHDFLIKNLTDENAQALINRKDSRGQKFVQKKSKTK